MKRPIGWLFVVGLLAAGCAPAVNVEQQKNALMEADRAWAATTTNLDNMMAGFAADAAVFPAGMPITKGHEAIREMIGGMMKVPGFALTWSPIMADVSASGDLGWTHGNYEMTMPDAAGNPMTEKGKYVTVWKKQSDGSWKVVADMFNSDAPPPAPPPAPAMKK